MRKKTLTVFSVNISLFLAGQTHLHVAFRRPWYTCMHSFAVGIAASQKKPHLSAYAASIRQHTPAYASIRQHTPVYARIRQHTCMHSFAVRFAAVRGGRRRALRGRLIRLLSRGSLQQPFASLTKKRKIRGGKEKKGKRKKKGGEYLDIGLVRTVTSFSSGVGSCK